jgi:succinate dehydrogenase / fumarate reductase cytochrome b subunit
MSPHLQIYKWHVTMVVSILHRATGVALVIGTFFLVGWLWAAAYDPACFASIHKFFTSFLGKLMLFGWALSFYFHFCNGIRHLVWDIGKGFEVHTAERTAWVVIIASVVLTLLTWLGVH